MRKRIPALLLSLLFLLSPLAGAFSAESNVLRIYTSEDFVEFCKNCSLDAYSKGLNVYLEADLTLTEEEFTPVPYFAGAFYGKSHSIRGLSFTESHSKVGLFSQLAAGASVRDLTVKALITPGGEQSEVGGIVGYNLGQIQNCVFMGLVAGDSSTGGIAGYNGSSGSVYGCSVYGTVEGTHYTGGIVGYNEGTVRSCTSSAAVNTNYEEISLSMSSLDVSLDSLEGMNVTESIPAHTDTGGIAGYSSGLIDGCANSGAVGYPHVGYNIGGVAGRQSGITVNCSNSGAINGRKDVGGIVGQMAPNVLLQFTGSTSEELQEALNTLNTLIDKTLTDAAGTSKETTAEAGNAIGYLDSAKDSLKDINKALTGFVDGNIDAANSYVNLTKDAVGDLSTVLEALESAAGSLSEGLSKAGELTEVLAQMSVYTGEALDALGEALPYLSAMAEGFSKGAAQLEKAMELLGSTPQTALDKEQLKADIALFQQALQALSESYEAAKAEYEQTGAVSEETRTAIAENLQAAVNALKPIGVDLYNAIKDTDWASLLEIAASNATEIFTALKKALGYFSDGFSAMAEAGDALEGFITALQSMNGLSDELLSGVRETLNAFSQSASSLKTAIAAVKDWAVSLSQTETPEFTKLGEGYSEGCERLDGALTGLSSSIAALNNTVGEKSQTLIGDLAAVNRQFSVVMNLFLNALNDTENLDYENLYEDVSDEDVYAVQQGKVSSCQNGGAVAGDLNVGGLAGSMAIEYDLDPEDDIATAGNASYSFKYQTRAVLLSCINTGAVTSKKDCAGGNVGRMDLGTVVDCENYGSVTSEAGDYTGGIAGKSGSTIRSCYVKCTLSGRKYIGGVAGSGYKISSCAVMTAIPGGGQLIGAIAGEVTEAASGNVFVSDTLSGIDRVSYEGKAEPVSYRELLRWEGLPAAFSSFTLVFTAEDVQVGKAVFSYGDSLTDSAIPTIPGKAGYYACWSRSDFTALTFDEIVTAQYTPYTEVLSSGALRASGRPAFLLEGGFTEGETFLAETQSKASGELERVLLTLPKDEDSYQVRYLSPTEETKHIEIYRVADGKEEKLKTESYGSYLVFTLPAGESLLAVKDATPNVIGILLPCLGGLLALLLLALAAALLHQRKKRRGK